MWLFFGLALIDTPDLIEQKLFSSLSITNCRGSWVVGVGKSRGYPKNVKIKIKNI